MNTEIFNEAVHLVQKGETSLAIANALENEFLGVDILEIRTVIANANEYVKQLQTQAFEAAMAAFQRGESHFQVSKKLRELGFQSWDADTLAWRAQAKAAETQAEGKQ
jgi:hypothetical protein